MGVQLEFIEKFLKMLTVDTDTALMMDEMKLKSGLVFNKHSGTLVGFVDLSRVNNDIQQILADRKESSTGAL